MADKTFTVSHAHARAPLIVHGKDLETAIRNEGLDPDIWKEIQPTIEPEPEPDG